MTFCLGDECDQRFSTSAPRIEMWSKNDFSPGFVKKQYLRFNDTTNFFEVNPYPFMVLIISRIIANIRIPTTIAGYLRTTSSWSCVGSPNSATLIFYVPLYPFQTASGLISLSVLVDIPQILAIACKGYHVKRQQAIGAERNALIPYNVYQR